MIRLASAALLAVAGLSAITALAIAQPDRPSRAPAAAGGGGGADHMQACILAGTPGPQHEYLARSVGVWSGKTQMWFGPGAEPVRGECTNTVASLFDGRYTTSEVAASLPGLGSFEGRGVNGYDNVSGQFVGSWYDSHSTGIMTGVGVLSSDSKTLTWTYTVNCPVTRKPTALREVQTTTGPDTQTFEMFTTDPASGREYKCMHIDYTRRS
jgi:uncharacterized protein DUF1579